VARYTMISIRMPPEWLGYVDYLVDSGYFVSRSNFVRESIRNAIRSNKAFINQVSSLMRGRGCQAPF